MLKNTADLAIEYLELLRQISQTFKRPYGLPEGFDESGLKRPPHHREKPKRLHRIITLLSEDGTVCDQRLYWQGLTQKIDQFRSSQTDWEMVRQLGKACALKRAETLPFEARREAISMAESLVMAEQELRRVKKCLEQYKDVSISQEGLKRSAWEYLWAVERYQGRCLARVFLPDNYDTTLLAFCANSGAVQGYNGVQFTRYLRSANARKLIQEAAEIRSELELEPLTAILNRSHG